MLKSQPRFLLAEEAKQFLKAAQGDRLSGLFAVAEDSGMRPSELLGLRWQDLNMETGLISVQHGLKWNRKGGGYELGKLKNANSRRCIKLLSALPALKKHRTAQHDERLALGSGYENNDFVFDDHPRHPTRTSERDRPTSKANSLQSLLP
jgi:integrase